MNTREVFAQIRCLVPANGVQLLCDVRPIRDWLLVFSLGTPVAQDRFLQVEM